MLSDEKIECVNENYEKITANLTDTKRNISVDENFFKREKIIDA